MHVRHTSQPAWSSTTWSSLRKAAGQALRGLAWPEGAGWGFEGMLPRPLLSCTQALDEDLQREARNRDGTPHLQGGRAGGLGREPAALSLHPAQHHFPALPQMVGDVRKDAARSAAPPDSIQNDEVSALRSEVLGSAENARVHWGPVLV